MFEFGGKENENGTAILIEPRKDHKYWKKYINKLAENRDLVTKLQNNLHDLVKDKYSMENVCKQRVEFYRRIMNKK